MLTFYQAALESILRYGMTAWFGNLPVALKAKLAHLVQTAMKIIGQKQYKTTNPSSIFEQIDRILFDPLHVLFSQYCYHQVDDTGFLSVD